MIIGRFTAPDGLIEVFAPFAFSYSQCGSGSNYFRFV
jgi:hypothetical protein